MTQLRLLLFTGAAVVGCGAPPAPAVLTVLSGNGQTTTASTELPINPTVAVVDSAGRPQSRVAIAFRVIQGGGWVARDTSITDRSGRASVSWYVGSVADEPQTLEASAGSLRVRFEATARRPSADVRQFGANQYVEWVPGDLPIVISAPHGGVVHPRGIRKRTSGIDGRDEYTTELAVEISNAFQARLGRRPHLILNRLARTALDANRGIVEAAEGNPIAERAWREFQGFIEASVAEVRQESAMGFFIDLHGHAHPIDRIELGYLLDRGALNLADMNLSSGVAGGSSLWPMAAFTGTPFHELLRGRASLGAHLEAVGSPSVPSPTNPSPGNEPFFSGGYNTMWHWKSRDNRFAGVQIETQLAVRETPVARAAFATALATGLEGFLKNLLHAPSSASSQTSRTSVPSR